MNTIIGTKELRNRMGDVAKAVAKGQSFTVVNRSRPIFSIQSPQALDEFGDPVDYYNKHLDLRDKKGEGMPVAEFKEILESVIAARNKDKKNERQNPKVSG